jgi:hypothetical protein
MLFGYSDYEAHINLLFVLRNENFRGNPHALAVLASTIGLILQPRSLGMSANTC